MDTGALDTSIWHVVVSGDVLKKKIEKINAIDASIRMGDATPGELEEYDKLLLETDRIIYRLELYENRIQRISDRYERELLQLYYINKSDMKQICKKLDINMKRFIEVHNSGVKKVKGRAAKYDRLEERKFGKERRK